MSELRVALDQWIADMAAGLQGSKRQKFIYFQKEWQDGHEANPLLYPLEESADFWRRNYAWYCEVDVFLPPEIPAGKNPPPPQPEKKADTIPPSPPADEMKTDKPQEAPASKQRDRSGTAPAEGAKSKKKNSRTRAPNHKAEETRRPASPKKPGPSPAGHVDLELDFGDLTDPESEK